MANTNTAQTLPTSTNLDVVYPDLRLVAQYFKDTGTPPAEVIDKVASANWLFTLKSRPGVVYGISSAKQFVWLMNNSEPPAEF